MTMSEHTIKAFELGIEALDDVFVAGHGGYPKRPVM